MKLFLCGDVMTGRGVDQILAHPGNPELHESYLKSALRYVEIAETASGAIPRGVDAAYVWGDALEELERFQPDARIINLETAVTASDSAWPGKEVHYRMHPANVSCLAAAKVDCCVLANNHVLDWGHRGLAETLLALHQAGIRTAGAGTDHDTAAAPAVLRAGTGGRLLLFAFGSPSAGVPSSWGAGNDTAGVHLLDESDAESVTRVVRALSDARRPADRLVASIHWGSNWGYRVTGSQRVLAHRLVDEAGVDIVHGHSSHHPRPIEVYQGKLILYGCGDFLNDYEGIGGYEAFRPELSLMYLPELDASDGRLRRLVMVPMHIRRFRLNRASQAQAQWLAEMLDREGRPFGTGAAVQPGGAIELRWN